VISLVERTQLPASAEGVWSLFEQMEDVYADWHREHLRWRWLSGEPLAKGSVWFADEWVGPMRISSRFFVTESEPERLFAYRIGFPSSLVRAGGSFRLEPIDGDECVLIEEAHFGFGLPLVGSIVDLFLRLALPISEFRRHIREEGKGLAELLEARAHRSKGKSTILRRET
jgi:hypothetical protein